MNLDYQAPLEAEKEFDVTPVSTFTGGHLKLQLRLKT